MSAARKKSGEDMPEEYRQGYVDFLGCRIDLSRRVLIPRPEPEFWANLAIKDLQNSDKKELRVLDIFSGSGCVGVAVAKKVPNALVDFSDCDPEAIAQIEINIANNLIGANRARVIKSNIFERIPGACLYDAILANPPYIDPRRIAEVQPSVLDYEPHVALFGGARGLEIVDKFLAQAKKFLKPKGFIYLEFDPLQKDEIKNILVREKYSEFYFFKDQYDAWRFVKILN